MWLILGGITGRYRAKMTKRLMIIVLLLLAIAVIIMVKRYMASDELDCPCCNRGGGIGRIIG